MVKVYAKSDLYNLFEEKVNLYNQPEFIDSDPIQIPRRFSGKENIEISGFLAATIAWGKRSSIIKNAKRLIAGMDNNPYHFIMETDENEWLHLADFKHRTFNSTDLFFFLKSLQHIYKNRGGLETVFTDGFKQEQTIFSAIKYFREVFFEIEFPDRTRKHVSDVTKNSAAKRINMFLRWMVRNDNKGVDLGIWGKIPASKLMLPLDVHVGNVSRELGILQRKQNDWKAVEEVTNYLRIFDPNDPAKYDFALFGMGIFEGKHNHKHC